MNIKEVVRQYVASRKSTAPISTQAASIAINAVMRTNGVVSPRELDNMIAEEAVRKNLTVHFDSHQ